MNEYFERVKGVIWQVEQLVQDASFMVRESERKKARAGGQEKPGRDRAEKPAAGAGGLAVDHAELLKGGGQNMKANIKAKLDNYLELLNEIKARVGEEATAARILTELAKDVRMEQIREERQVRAEPATAKQLQFMKTLGIEVPAGCSKTEASRLLDEELGRNGGEE
jgi:hypothetical protein